MVAQPYIAGWIRVVFRLAHEGSTVMVPMNFKTIGISPTPSSLAALTNDLATTVWPTLRACLANTFALTLIEATDRSAPGGAYANTVVLSGFNGDKGTDALPANVANVIKWTTGFAGRSYRGRTYVPGWVDADANGSTFQTAAMGQAQTLATLLLAYPGPAAQPVDFVVASIKDLALRIVTGFAVDAIVDSQRRRLPGRGF